MATSNDKFIPPATRLRRLLEEAASSKKPIVCPGVYDGLTARIALGAGHKSLYMTGAGTTASALGAADLGLLTMTEMAGNARMIASLDPTAPLIADADTGFGAPLNVARTVKTYIEAGVAGMHLEDQVVAKRCGHLGQKQLVSKEEFLLRIRAAAKARFDSGRDIVIIARSDALQGHGFGEALDRLRGAVAEGADCVFLEGIRSEDDGRRFCQAMGDVPCLLNIVAKGVSPNISAAQAGRIGYRIVIWPCAALTEVCVGVRKAMMELKETGAIEEREDDQGGVRDIFDTCGLNESIAFDAAVGGSAYGAGI